MRPRCRIVWFKRDLRVDDHQPLCEAAAAGDPLLPLFIIEPDGWQQPDSAWRHWAFARGCIVTLQERLAALGAPLLIRTGQAATVFAALARTCSVIAVHSHQETGNGWSYQRDRAVAAVLRDNGIAWIESRQHGVQRRLRSRDGWAAQWEALMAAPCLPAPAGLPTWPTAAPQPVSEPLPTAPPGLAPDAQLPRLQPSGRAAAERVLGSFLDARSLRYRGNISSPSRAWTASSRLSPYLTWGALSMREVVHASRSRRAQLRGTPQSAERSQQLRSLRAFEERLHWHCHFIQKLECEPAIEFRNLQRACDGLRDQEVDATRLAAWQRGETGYPLIDACMRALLHTGWLNFRMRALLVSFAAYHLWLHWREPALHLARVFTDYEPGIHYCQMQMQSGTTGINTLRIYNPLKQSLDQDPDGRFIRRWVPELAALPTDWLHQPWTLPASLQRSLGCRLGDDYPQPVVDHAQAAREARLRFTGVRRDRQANREADAIRVRHGSRRRQPPRPRKPVAGGPVQTSLFDDDRP